MKYCKIHFGFHWRILMPRIYRIIVTVMVFDTTFNNISVTNIVDVSEKKSIGISNFKYSPSTRPVFSVSRGWVRGRDRMVVGLTTTRTISAYYH